MGIAGDLARTICAELRLDGEHAATDRSPRPGRTSAVLALLAAGANPNVRAEDGWCPLLPATVVGSVDMTAALLQAGADVNVQDPNRSTALIKATLWRHVAVVRVLLAHGADASLADDRGWTPLAIARLLEHAELIDLLERNALRRRNP